MGFFLLRLVNARRQMAGALLGLGACNHAPNSASTMTAAVAPAPAVPAAISWPRPSKAAADSATQTAVRFFAWYQRHRSEVNDFHFLASADDDDTTQASGVRLPQVSRFLRLLRSSRCVSTAYLQDWDAYFHRQDDELRDISTDGNLVSEFESEMMFFIQEGEPYLKQMDRVPKKVTFPAADRAVVTAFFPPSSSLPDNKVFYLRRYPSGWLIDSIQH